MKRRRLGQHYLVDKSVVDRIVALASISPHENVLEIGTGKGALTKELASFGSRVEAYELDRQNYRETLKSLGESSVALHLGDAFDHKPDFDVLVSSLPYSESSRFVEWLSGIRYDRAVVLLQEDFVRKLIAPPGSRDYRAISALAQVSSAIKVLAKVGRASFSPRPRVNSAIVMFTPRLTVTKEEVKNIYRLFSLRRRRVAAALRQVGMNWKGGDYGDRRVYSLTPEEVHRLCSPQAQ